MRPRPHQPVVVHLPASGEVQAFVEEADADTITLVVAVPDDVERVAPGADAVVEYASPSGVHRLKGTVSARPLDETRLAFRRTPPDDEIIQRREWARVDTQLVVDVTVDGEVPTQLGATVAVNISGGGALIADQAGLPIGARVQLRLHLESGSIDAAAIVVRITEHGERGLRIVEIGDTERERIIRFVASVQRSELARRRQRVA